MRKPNKDGVMSKPKKGEKRAVHQLKDELMKISQRCSKLPDLDTRSPEEILGYDQHGLPR